MKKILLLSFATLTALQSFSQSKLTAATIDQKVKSLVSQMTLEEKVGQMTQISIEFLLKQENGNVIEPHQIDMDKLATAIKKYKVGSLLNVGGNAQTRENWQTLVTAVQKMALQEHLKIPVLYGIDAIRGNNYTLSTVLFPQEIAQAASFNPEISRKASEISAYETRASFIPWTFSPVLDLGRQPMWPRIWETFGEDPYLGTQMGLATIKGFQGNELVEDKYHVAACLKHYMGYSNPLSGHDRTPAWIPENYMREYFLPQFAAAVKAGAKTVMVNSSEINGTPVHASHHILTDILKGELGFKGFAISDWQDIQYLYLRHHVAKDDKEAIAISINAGIDMSMVPTDYTFVDDLLWDVKNGKVSMARINDAVTRILKVKYEVDLFDHPIGNAADYPDFNNEAHNKVNYDAAAECITLLKNTNNLLPISAGKKLLVTGPTANTMRSLDGGWSRNWQGDNSDETEKDKNTILEAIQNVFGKNKVDYSQGVTFDKAINIEETVDKATRNDVIVLCLGENSYTETPGNINDLTISAPQIALATALAKTGKPIILVLAEGRPRIISAIEPGVTSVLHTYLLGNEGGNVIADALIGKINPSGRLPYTYPRYTNSLLNYYRKYTENKETSEVAGYDPQWEFGTGLSYTTFKYSNLKISSSKLPETGNITVSVDVTNNGKVAGKESVLMYV
ncbi:MAG: beta-glucosidase, partial [Sphingobacteriaceae bacterium]